MLRSGLDKFTVPRKPVALKPLPQFQTSDLSPRNSYVGNNSSAEYSSTYGRDDDEPLISSKPSISKIRNLTNRLPPRELPISYRRSTWRQFAVQSAVHFTLFVFMLFSIFVPLYVTRKVVYPLSQNAGNLPFFDCTYPGDFSFEGIDVPFGEMPFSVAKVYDLLFNAIVGRGMQTLLAFVCYRLFSVMLMHITESHRVSYPLFSALALAPVQIDSLKPTIMSLFAETPGFVKFQLFWLILTTLYLALFPSLIDSISGYQAVQSTMFKLPNETMLNTPLLVFHSIFNSNYDLDGINSTISKYLPPTGTMANTTFTFSNFGAGDLWISKSIAPSPAVYGYSTNHTHNPFNNTDDDGVYSDSVYINTTDGLYTSACINTTTSSVFKLRLVSQDGFPSQGSFNLSTYGISVLDYRDDTCNNWFHLQNLFVENDYIILASNKTESFVSNLAYTPGWNMSYFYDSNNYECVSGSKLKYQWGFSYEYLLIGTCINSFWLIGTYAIFLHASTRSQIATRGRKFGTWRAILDLAGALREDLGTESSAYGEKELEKAITGLGKEGRGVKYTVSGGEGDEGGGNGKDNPRLALSSSGSNARLFLQAGTVYG